ARTSPVISWRPRRCVRTLRIVATLRIRPPYRINYPFSLVGRLARSLARSPDAPPTAKLQAGRLAHRIHVDHRVPQLQTYPPDRPAFSRQASRLGDAAACGYSAVTLLQLLCQGLRNPGGPRNVAPERSQGQKTSLGGAHVGSGCL